MRRGGMQGGHFDAAAIREAFDRRFAEAPRPPAAAGAPVLVVRRGRRRMAVPLDSVAVVLPCAGIEPVPDAEPGWLGLAATRLGAVAVYGLEHAFEEEERGALPTPRWLLLVRGDAGHAIGCDEVAGLTEGALQPDTSERAPVSWDGDAVPVMDLKILGRARAEGEGG